MEITNANKEKIKSYKKGGSTKNGEKCHYEDMNKKGMSKMQMPKTPRVSQPKSRKGIM